VPNVLRAKMLWRARHHAREWADTHVERPVARALKVSAALRRGADVLYFGDSSLIHVSPTDTDKRRLGEMLAGESGLRIAQFYGPGYPAALHAQVARLLAGESGLPRPRCVIVSMPIRPTTHRHVVDHPVFGYASATAALATARRLDARLVRRLYKEPPSAEAYARFSAIERRSRWQLANTIGEYRERLRGFDAATADEDLQRVIFDYFHGEFSAEHPGLADWRRLGEYLRALDVPVIAYRTFMPLESGARLFGDDFVEHVDENYGLGEKHLFEGLGGGAALQFEPPPDRMFIAAQDSTEHLNEQGRRHVVAALCAAIRDRTA
jgi:hypothetical protein